LLLFFTGYTEDSSYKKMLVNAKPQDLFTISDNLDPNLFGQWNCLKGNLASVIKVTFEPSMAIH